MGTAVLEVFLIMAAVCTAVLTVATAMIVFWNREEIYQAERREMLGKARDGSNQ